MSAASRSLSALADHFNRLAADAAGWDNGKPLYSPTEMWDRAAEMTRAAADEETWGHRLVMMRAGWYRRWMRRRLARVLFRRWA